MRFNIIDTTIPGVQRIERQQLGDARGFLERLFCAEDLAAAGWRKPIAQINHTLTKKRGAVRGLHFQHPPYAEMKLVTCLRGAVWDVAVDLRSGSPSFLHWCAQELSADNLCSLLIPEGCAHGFQTLTDDAELLYLHSVAYAPAAEAGLNVRDPQLNIAWPMEISELSVRDTNHPLLPAGYGGLPVAMEKP